MTLEQYRAALAACDWYYAFSDDHRVWQRGEEQAAAISAAQKIHDLDFAIWNQYAPADCRVVKERA